MHPILLELGPLTLRSYGLMMALGFLAGIGVLVWLNRQEKREDDLVLDLALWIMVGSIIGARAMYVAVMPDQFKGAPLEVFKVWNGGLVYYGGLIGGSLATVWFTRRRRVPLWHIADIAAPALALGQAFGRTGCWLNGCCYGVVSEEHGQVFPSLGDHLPHLPTQLWEAGAALALAAFLLWWRGRRAYPGQVFTLYLLLYGVVRYVIELFRGDQERGSLLWDALSPGQWISIAAITTAVWLRFHLKDEGKNKS